MMKRAMITTKNDIQHVCVCVVSRETSRQSTQQLWRQLETERDRAA